MDLNWFFISFLIGLIAGTLVGMLIERTDWKRRIEKWGE